MLYLLLEASDSPARCSKIPFFSVSYQKMLHSNEMISNWTGFRVMKVSFGLRQEWRIHGMMKSDECLNVNFITET